MELTDLPNEVLYHIISQISLNSDLAKIVALSHRFKTLAEPLLYRSVHFHAEPVIEYPHGHLPVLKRTRRLIANLRARPELRKHTTSLSVRVTNFLWWQTDPHICIMKRMKQLRQVSFDPPAFYGTLPAECKHLSSVRFDFHNVTDHYDEEDGNSWVEHGIPLQIIAKNLWHPSLRKVQAEQVTFTPLFDYRVWLVQQRQQRGFPAVDDLRFLDCSPRIDYMVLSTFITTSKRLKCFVLDLVFPLRDNQSTTTTTTSHDPPVPMDLRPALDTHRLTLDTLALATTDRCPPFLSLSGSLIHWPALKRLAIPFPHDRARYPFLHAILPPQLELLQLQKSIWMALPTTPTASASNILIQYDGLPEDDLRLFDNLAANKDVYVPGLKWVVLWLQFPGGEEKEVEREKGVRLGVSVVEMAVGEGLGKVGVGFEVVRASGFGETPVGRGVCGW